MVNYLKEEFRRKTGLDVSESKRALIKLQTESNRIKMVLSQAQQTSVQMEGLYEGMDLISNITRARFEGMNGEIFLKISQYLRSVHEKWTCPAFPISSVIISGGHCKIPKIQQIIQGTFMNVKILSSINPAEVVVQGAAVQAELQTTRPPTLKPRQVVYSLSLTLGVEGLNGNFTPIVAKGTVIPFKVTKVFGCDPEQKQLCVSVYEGESEWVKDNRALGRFVVETSGEKVTSVVFLMEVNNLLTVYGIVKGKVTKFELAMDSN
eukprot:TRINITY_DN11450_c0_g2_i7.p1 TRINITY_DN11450_c0_g2~~TRINITY_DN11450_c0_g2_i7.p1  ORF type:complete len:264 (-),score=41.98 TRINITY_DN11450_c0_g2_i7:34-825(-)